MEPTSSSRLLHALAASLVVFAGVAVQAVTAALPAHAGVVAPFTLDYDQEVYGDFTMAGNANLKCQNASYSGPRTYTDAQCLRASNRVSNGSQSPDVNDSYFMVQNQVAGAPGSFNSSSANMTLPPGATVDYAKLSWAGNTGERGNGTGGSVSNQCGANPPMDAVKPPGSPSTQTVKLKVGTASPIDLAAGSYEYTVDPVPATVTPQYYSADATVTSAFTGALTGSPLAITVQDVWSPAGFGCFGGWSLTVVWKFGSANATYAANKKEVYIYDGHVRQNSTDGDTPITLNGFRVAGGTSNRVGTTAYEGDWGITGDRFLINGQAITEPSAGGAGTNFFVSNADGTSDPPYSNNFSVDAKSYPVASTVIRPGDTSAQLTFSTSGDSYLAQNLALSVPIPAIQMQLTADRSTARPGALVTYTITVKNTTDIAATNATVDDPLVPDCDRAVGTVAAQSEVTYTCEASAQSGDFANSATVTATNSFGDNLSDTSTTPTIDVIHPALSVSKTATPDEVAPGDTVTWRITVTNTGDAPVTGIAVTDPLVAACARPSLGTLAASATTTYTCTSVAGSTGVTNTATASGTDPEGASVTAGGSASFTVVEPVIPSAVDDVKTTPFGTPVTVSVLDNDSPASSSAPLDPTSVRLLSGTTPVTVLTVAGQGTYTAQPDGTITFTPLAGFHGVTTPATYQVTDSNGNVATAELGVTVSDGPKATPDSDSTPQNVDVAVSPLANDLPGGGATLVTSSVEVFDPVSGLWGSTATVAGEGTYTALADGTVTFDPAASFTGTSSVLYRFDDSDLNQASSSITIVVDPVSPTAVNDAATTPFERPVTVSVLGNDTAGSTIAPLVPASVRLLDGTNPVTALTVTGEGTYTSAAGGTVTFTPLADFHGVTTPVTYQVADANGTVVSAELVVAVSDGPKAQPDSDTTAQNTDVTVSPLANDTPGDAATFTPSTVQVFDPGTAAWGPTATIAGEGTYTVRADGTVTFDPDATFTGTSSILYRVTDSDLNQASSTITVVVDPVVPTGVNDAASTPFGIPVTVPVLVNDTAGSPAAPLDPASVRLVDGTTPVTTLTVAGEGTYTTAADGTIRFVPVAGFDGVATPVTYQVTDSNGTTADAILGISVNAGPVALPDPDTTSQNVDVTLSPLTNDTPGGGATLDPSTVQVFDATSGAWATATTVDGEGTYTAHGDGTITFDPDAAFTGTSSVLYRVTDSDLNQTSSNITIVVDPVIPTAVDDARNTPFGTPVTVTVLTNDTPGSPAAALDPQSVRLMDGVDPVTTLTVAGQGTYVARPDGTITFTPLAGFHGVTTPVTYQVADSNGTITSAELGVTVTEGPQANPDSRTTPQNVDVTVSALNNDTPGEGASLGAGTMQVFDPATGLWGPTVTLPDEGTYTALSDGTVTFVPEATFTGTSSVQYRVTDSDGNQVSSTITIVVDPVTPTAIDDSTTTPFDTAVTVPVLGNDTAGAASAPLQPASVRLLDGTTSVTALVVAGEGTYTTHAAGTISFAPVPGFHGVTTPVTYQVTDTNGTTIGAELGITVSDGPKAALDTDNTSQNVDVTVSPLGNDTPGGGAALVSSSVQVFDPATGLWGSTVALPDESTYTAHADGTVTFDPNPSFTGTSSILYRASDSDRNQASSSIAIVVDPVTPDAVDDARSTPFDTPVTVPVLDNDDAGSPDAPLDPTSVRLLDGTSPVTTLVVVDQGTYTAHPDGTITFAPVAGYHGVTSPVGYQVADSNGTTTAALVAITVTNGPTASLDADSTAQDVDVTVSPLVNDTPGAGAAFDASTLEMFDPTSDTWGSMAEIAGEGTYSVHADGTVTFDPETSFTGTSSVEYRVTDSDDNQVGSTITIVVDPVTPVALDDARRTPFNTAVTVNVLGNDRTGSAAAPLDPSSVVLLDGANPVTTLTVAGAGTYTVHPDGTITFTPVTGFHGAAPPVTYQVTDANGTVASADLTITVSGPPAATARPDRVTGKPGQSVTISPLDDDSPSNGAAWVSTSLCLVTPDGRCVKRLSIAGQGTYTVHADGTVTFVPVSGFHGTSTVGYRVTDTNGLVASSTIVVTIPDAAVTPTTTHEQPLPTTQAPEPTARQPDPPAGLLPRTGTEIGQTVQLGLALLAGGLVLLLGTRSTRRTRRT